MGESGIIEKSAKQALFARCKNKCDSDFLWDCVKRVVRNAELICRIIERDEPRVRINKEILNTGAYFSQVAGLILKFYSENSKPLSTDSICRNCSDLTRKELGTILTDSRLKSINSIVVGSYDKKNKEVESKILSDSRNLDDVGIVGLFWDIRKSMLCGKSVSDVITGWKRKVEYGYWQARLKEDFRFEQVRTIAEKRLCCAESFMNCLENEHKSMDFEELSDALAEAG
jgi:hypothetical protein